MTARVSRNFSFDAGMHNDDMFVINHYEIALDINVFTENIREQNIALERIKFVLEANLENSVFVDESRQEVIDKYKFAGIRVCPIPDEPYDQIIGAVIMSKLNAIVEDRMHISEITILSKLCDGVSFHISEQEDTEFSSRTGVWYTDPSPCICLISKKNNQKLKIVPLKNIQTWQDLGLGWKEPELPQVNNEISFINTDTSPLH